MKPRKPHMPAGELIQVEVRDQVARAISGFAMWVNGHRAESHVEEKQQAEKAYQDGRVMRVEVAELPAPPGAHPTLARSRIP